MLDVKKSKISWKVVTVGKHSGFIVFNNGVLKYSVKNEPVGGAFNLNMNGMHSISETSVEKNEKIDEELRSPNFFDVGKYQTASIYVKK